MFCCLLCCLDFDLKRGLILDQVDFVPDFYQPVLERLRCETYFLHDLEHLLVLVLGLRIANVSHMDNQVRKVQLIKCGFEAFD